MTDTSAAMLSALAWQIELGATEAIGENALDRFEESAPKPEAKLATPVATATSQPDASPAIPRASDGDANAAPDARPEQAQAPQSDAAALARTADSLDALAKVMQDWDGSPLKAGARNFVFADGLAGASVMVIGEAPGADEDRMGKPFVGRAGQLLDRMLAAIGLARTAPAPEKAVYIANILPWRPPGNRTPSEQEALSFLPFMERHIELAKPDVILSMGNTPTKAMLRTATGIKRMRGTWVRHPATGVPVMPTFHPAYLLRQSADKRLAWRDLLAVQAVLDGGKPPL